MTAGAKASYFPRNPSVPQAGSSVCRLSLLKAELWPFLLEMGMATLPSEKEYVSANFHEVQNLVGSFLRKFTLSVLPLKSPYGIV